MKPTTAISLCMIVKNEGDLLGPLLETVRSVIPQMVVVDTGSTDRTMQVARQAGAAVYQHPLNHDFAAARNFALTKVTAPWALQLDADEMPAQYLLEWCVQFVTSNYVQMYDAVQVRRFNELGGAALVGREYEWHIRLFRSYLRYTGAIHECITGVRSVTRAPADFLLRHAKSLARQHRQDEFYKEWQR